MENNHQVPDLTPEQTQQLWENFLNLLGMFGGPIGKRNASYLQGKALKEAEKFLYELRPGEIPRSINIGDKVKIVKPGKLYTTYDDKFLEMGFKNTKYNNYPDHEYGRPIPGIWTVFAKSWHPQKRVDLLGIENEEGIQLLIDSTGVDPAE